MSAVSSCISFVPHADLNAGVAEEILGVFVLHVLCPDNMINFATTADDC